MSNHRTLRVGLSAIALFLPGILAGCWTSPGVPDEAHGPIHRANSPQEQLEVRVSRNPGDLEAWQELALSLAIAGDSEAAFDAADRCTRANPRDPRAWLIHASTARALNDYVTASASLDTAVGIGGSRDALRARASFYMELERWEFAVDDWKALVELGDQEAGLGLARCWWMALDPVRARAALAAIPQNSDARAAADSMLAQLALIEAKPVADDAWGHLSPAMLMRWSSSAARQDVQLRVGQALTAALETHDQPEARLACLIGQWQIAWQAETLRSTPGVPPSHTRLAERIRTLGGHHPEWLIREALVSELAGTPDRYQQAKQRLSEAGLLCPAPAKTHRGLMAHLRAHDLASLGELALVGAETDLAADLALRHAPDDPGLWILKCECMVACRQGEPALWEIVQRGDDGPSWTQLKLRAMLANGLYDDVVRVVGELSPELRRRIRADSYAGMARYHRARAR